MKTNRTIVMLDIETLAREADAVILQIALVKYHSASGNCLACVVEPGVAGQINQGRKVDQDTLDWWEKRGGWKQTRTLPCAEAAEKVVRWLEAHLGPEEEIWCAGCDFDFPILRSFLETCRPEGGPGWEFWQQRDFRTLRKLAEGRTGKMPRNNHDALDDALAQAVWAYRCLDALSNEAVTAPHGPGTRNFPETRLKRSANVGKTAAETGDGTRNDDL